ncbi:BREX-1 system adenine-specific DNA-methyltransferase PglX [Brucella tritici]|uniref:BREX-1 system adenine-specific DNA-methyltransferase PglX n=1 Tax=Brucella tritici TaxID=94626 RepID=UPI00124E4C5E|nr:BREX-1 system adenine-specific DNA-methyltransferase PglX [Brucella tritici]KAB2678310.1 BREX-1 system adenine-specific DNA-methyltransferase PglX [Brucella tritici]
MATNRNALKTYAPKARKDFIAAVAARAAKFGITKKEIAEQREQGDVVLVGSDALPKKVGEQRRKLVGRIKQVGFDEAMEAVAYTWFNRLIAIRYMEIHGLLDHGYRVLSHPSGKELPEILEHAEHLDLPGLDKGKVIDLKLDGTKDAELYRMLLIAQCNALHRAMPFLFERIDDETELLLPDNLLHSDSLIRKLVAAIDEADWQEIEIIGWLYQFYISEKKDQVFAGLKKNQKITAENIPAATQLFTPHWIVRYLVENSLGRLWLLNRPGSKLAERMDYYIAPAEPETDFLKIDKPEEIKVCDPACGSGHMLTYAFDLLYEIYEEEGYDPKQIPALILKHNLTGIELDDRAGALAAFALTMKAAAKLGRRRFQRMEEKPEIVVLQDVSFTPAEMQDVAAVVGRDLFTDALRETLTQFEQAKNFGSLIVPKLRDPAETLRIVDGRDFGSDLLLKELQGRIVAMLRMVEALTPRYHVVVANPPYMNSSGMNDALKSWGKAHYTECWGKGRSDTFAMFIARALLLIPTNGFSSMVTMESWMFLGTFRALREALLSKTTILSMVHMPYLGRGGTSMGINFGTSAFVLRKASAPQEKGHFSCTRYFETDDFGVPFEFPTHNERLALASAQDFLRLPLNPIAYWLSEAAKECFDRFPTFADRAIACQGLATTDNNRFVREWSEVSHSRCGFGCANAEEALSSGLKWFPMDKGGDYRRWYGNNFAIVNWEFDGKEIRDNIVRKYPYLNGNPDFVAKNPSKYFLPGVTWGKITSGEFSSRFTPQGSIFSDAGMKAFPLDKNASPLPILGLLNSKIAPFFLSAFSETMNFEQGDISRIPFANVPVEHLETIVGLSKSDWDSQENSWDFSTLPLLSPDHRAETLAGGYARLRTYWQSMTAEMQRLEKENNRIFIDAYGLHEELTSEVPIEEITLTCNPAHRYGAKGSEAEREARLLADTMKELLSYAIGCMMGRYSLIKPGLIYASSGNEGFDASRYGDFPADSDGIVPITNLEWFDDDAAVRFEEFLKVAWSPDTLRENLRFVAESLAADGGNDPQKTIRNYFAKSFFKDHLKTYKKRPIYWLFSSGKLGAFECLVYLHRYNESTLSRMRMEYVTPLQSRMVGRIEQLADDVAGASSSAARNKAQKERDLMVAQLEELRAFDEELRHYADQRITLDLDDGVKVNYGKFGSLLAERKAIAGDTDGD